MRDRELAGRFLAGVLVGIHANPRLARLPEPERDVGVIMRRFPSSLFEEVFQRGKNGCANCFFVILSFAAPNADWATRQALSAN